MMDLDNFTEFLLEDVSPKTVKKLLLSKFTEKDLEKTAKRYMFSSFDKMFADYYNKYLKIK